MKRTINGVSRSHFLRLPASLPEQPRADEGERREPHGDGDEHAGRRRSRRDGRAPTPAGSPSSQKAEQRDARRRPRVAGAVERLRQHHPVAVEEEAGGDDAQAADAVRRDLRIVGEDADEQRREEQEDEPDGAQAERVVEARRATRPLRRAPGLPAPRFWPTSVAAALLTPNDGSSANRMMRIAMALPATAALPKPVRMRTSPIHDAVHDEVLEHRRARERRMPRMTVRVEPRCARRDDEAARRPGEVIELIEHAAAAADRRADRRRR